MLSVCVRVCVNVCVFTGQKTSSLDAVPHLPPDAAAHASRASPDSASHLALGGLGLQVSATVLTFHGFRGYELRSSCLQSLCFTH